MNTTRQRGMNLVELAIVMTVIGLLLGGGLMALTAQMETQREKDARALLVAAKEALIGFAQVNGRLPCPATASSNGQEAPLGGGVCAAPSDANGYYGFLPAATLGIANEPGGYLLDPWKLGAASRLRYAVTRKNANAATTVNGIKSNYSTFFSSGTFLRICAQASCIGSTQNAVAVLIVPGANAANMSTTGVDEQENVDNDRDFVAHEKRGPGGSGGEFDDLVDFIPPALLASRMIAAGQLP
ncbi:type II secretion system protein [Hydrogenophilus thiooxidans]|uniref:type II secretion system protein n=1 Tax=Hydrogenophilus thiooxidans TaxID=2820326 RepID=UPI001C2423D9|nr:prepilin-type N-terminal cleavage/methylation domain-containing protein [Hydrogenophilus thiooxidans]